MAVNKLLMTVGLPRSGKSTWCNDQGIPMVNPDSIRLALHGEVFIPSAEPFIWAIAKVMVGSLFLAGHDTIILDATNTTAARREEWRSNNWTREFVVFDTDAETCIERAMVGGREYLVEPITKMADEYEPVTEDELDIGESVRRET